MNTAPIARHSILAVWHWPRWVLVCCVILAVLSPPFYFLSLVPVLFSLERDGLLDDLSKSNFWADTFEVVYTPAFYGMERFPILYKVMDYEIELLLPYFEEDFAPQNGPKVK